MSLFHLIHLLQCNHGSKNRMSILVHICLIFNSIILKWGFYFSSIPYLHNPAQNIINRKPKSELRRIQDATKSRFAHRKYCGRVYQLPPRMLTGV